MSKTPLSNIISIENLPEQLSFISDGLNTVFDNLYYSDLEVFEDLRGQNISYALNLSQRLNNKLTRKMRASAEQLGQKGDVKEGSEDGRDLRLLLAKNMFLVFLELLIMNIDDTEKVKTFYDTQLISSRTTKKKVAEKPTK